MPRSTPPPVTSYAPPSLRLMRPDQLERRLRERLDALGPAPRAELLHVLMTRSQQCPRRSPLPTADVRTAAVRPHDGLRVAGPQPGQIPVGTARHRRWRPTKAARGDPDPGRHPVGPSASGSRTTPARPSPRSGSMVLRVFRAAAWAGRPPRILDEPPSGRRGRSSRSPRTPTSRRPALPVAWLHSPRNRRRGLGRPHRHGEPLVCSTQLSDSRAPDAPRRAASIRASR